MEHLHQWLFSASLVSLDMFLIIKVRYLVKAYSLTNLIIKARDIKSIATLMSKFVRFSVHNSEIWVMHFFIIQKDELYEEEKET